MRSSDSSACWHRNGRPHGHRAGLRPSSLAYGQRGLPSVLPMLARDRHQDGQRIKWKHNVFTSYTAHTLWGHKYRHNGILCKLIQKQAYNIILVKY